MTAPQVVESHALVDLSIRRGAEGDLESEGGGGGGDRLVEEHTSR